MTATTTTVLVYSSMTGDAPADMFFSADLPAVVTYEDDAYCFVCGRCTDHAGEHDDLVAAGMAAYEANGSVVKTAAYDRDRAREIVELAYVAYLAGPVAYEAFCKALEAAA